MGSALRANNAYCIIWVNIPFGVVINRCDLGNKDVDNYCRKRNIPILMQIPFSKGIVFAYSKNITVVEALPEYKKHLQELFDKIGKIGKITKYHNKRITF